MKAALYSGLLLALAIAVLLWRIGTPVDSSQCANTAPGLLTGFIRQHFSDRQGADWRDDGSALGILGVAEAQPFARQPERYYCEALNLVLIPRGTALNYWWLPQWRSRFQRDAPGILAETDIKEILSGEHWFDYPGRGY